MKRLVNFNYKALVSFLTVLIWLLLIGSGMVLYLAPPGRVANWIIWRLAAMTKDQWQAIHTIFAFLFILVGALHLYLNWRVFWSYFKNSVQRGIKMGRELIAAILLVLATVILVLGEVPPFRTVMSFGENLKNSWSSEQSEPPLPHAELLTLKEFSAQTGQDLNRIMQNLKHAGLIGVDSLMSLENLAVINNQSPQEIVQKLSRPGSAQQTQTSLSGLGRKTVSVVCTELGIDRNRAYKRLEQAGVQFNQNQKIKEVAEINNLRPVDIVNILRGEEEGETP